MMWKKADGSIPGPTGTLWGNRGSSLSVISMRSEPQGGRWDWSQTSQSHPSEKEKWWYTCRPFRTNTFKERAMWRIDPLLSSDSVNSDCF
jgi:exonuclease III